MDLPLVSIVTPAFNQAEFLAQTIESVLGQTYRNIEYIVLDDGSTDDTRNVLQRYTGRLIWESHANIGQAGTLNKGWRTAKGDILGYLSADDLLHPRAIETSMRFLARDPTLAATYCDFNLIDGKGNFVRLSPTEDFDLHRLAVDIVCQPGPGALFTRSAFEAVGGWREDLRQVADYEFWLRISEQGTFQRIPEPLASWRMHDASASVRPIDAARCNEIVRVIEEFWHGKDPRLARRARSRALCIAASFHLRSGRFSDACRAYARAAHSAPLTALNAQNLAAVAAGTVRGCASLLGRRKI